MSDQPPQLPRDHILTDPFGLAATWFGIGLSQRAPGTLGSLASMPYGILIHYFLGGKALAIAAVIVFFIGIKVSNIYMKRFERTGDPKEVVIDEVAGQWLVLSVTGLSIHGYALGFILFRMFDILKPWPISWADRNIKQGFGVMFDDILAAGYAALAWLMLEFSGLFAAFA